MTLRLPLVILLSLGAGAALLPQTSRVVDAVPPAETATFKVDPGHTSVVFRITHLGVSAFYGRFNGVTGSVQWSKDDPSATSINITVDANSVDTNDEKREQHLKGPDFFSVKQHPTITFKSTKVTGSAKSLKVTGDLTLLGKTKQVSFDATLVGERALGKRMGHRAGWEATLTIKRSEFGMKYAVANGILGDEVKLTISLEGIRQ